MCSWSFPPPLPELNFLDVSSGWNVAIVDEGKLDTDHVVKHIRDMARCNNHIYDGLDVVFIDKSHFERICETIKKPQDTPKESRHFADGPRTGLVEIMPNVFTLDATLGGNHLGQAVNAAVAGDSLLLVKSNSIHQVIDLSQSVRRVEQLTLLNPQSEKQVSYVAAFTESAVFSLAHFSCSAPSG